MTDLADLLDRLAERGVRLEAAGGRLRFHPRSSVTPDLLERLKALKPRLLRMLSTGDDGDTSSTERRESPVPSPSHVGRVAISPVPPWLDLAAVWAWLDEQPQGAAPAWCPRYRHPVGWRSIHGAHLICGSCHPPAIPEVVAEWIDTDCR